MTVTAIKRIHNFVPSGVSSAVTVTVRNAARNRTFVPDFSFTRRQDEVVDWWIPWAWEERHFTIDRQHIDVVVSGHPGIFSIWQQDEDIWMTQDGSFTGPRTRLGDTGGDRQLLIFPDHLELIGMFDQLPAASALCNTFSGNYAPLTSGGDDVRVSPEGTFRIDNIMWLARFHSAHAGFEKRVFSPSGGAPLQIEASWDLNPIMRADGVGYARAQLVMKLEAHPENMSTGTLEAPFVNEQVFWRQTIVFGFVQPSGHFYHLNPRLSLNITERSPTDYYVLRAFLQSDVGGFGWINAEASCFGRFLGFDVCRL